MTLTVRDIVPGLRTLFKLSIPDSAKVRIFCHFLAILNLNTSYINISFSISFTFDFLVEPVACDTLQEIHSQPTMIVVTGGTAILAKVCWDNRRSWIDSRPSYRN